MPLSLKWGSYSYNLSRNLFKKYQYTNSGKWETPARVKSIMTNTKKSTNLKLMGINLSKVSWFFISIFKT